MRTHDPIKTVAVGQSYCRQTEAVCLLDKLIRMTCAFEK
jgi:hypothetical protein